MWDAWGSWRRVGKKTPSRQGLGAEENMSGEVAGMAEALEHGPRDRVVLMLADLRAAIQAGKDDWEDGVTCPGGLGQRESGGM